MYGQEFNQLIKEIGNEKNIQVEELSYGYVLKLSKGKIQHYIIGYKFDLSSHAVGSITRDKYATYMILKEEIPIVEHNIIFNPNTREGYQNINLELVKYLKQRNEKIVVKPNTGHEGIGVFLCETKEELEKRIEELFQTNNSVILSPYYEIDTEYRTIYLDGECLLTYGKKIPKVIGDGIHNVEELIKQNKHIRSEKMNEKNMKNVRLSDIPRVGQEVPILWKHNLSGGAIPQILEEEELKIKIQDIVKKAAKILNIRFASIDVIQTKTGELYLLEINSGVFMKNFMNVMENGREIVKNIYTKAVEKMFEEE